MENPNYQIFWACRGGEIALIKRLLATAAQPTALVNKLDNFQRTPIFYTCWNGFHDCTRLLISYGALLELEDMCGNNPFDYARSNGHEQQLLELLRQEAALRPSPHGVVENAIASWSKCEQDDTDVSDGDSNQSNGDDDQGDGESDQSTDDECDV